VILANDQRLYLRNRNVASGLVNLIRDNQDERLDLIRDEIRTNYPDRRSMSDTVLEAVDETQAVKALEFAIRLWLHLSPTFELSSSVPALRLVDWIETRLPARTSGAQVIEGTLSNDFCVAHLARKGGMVIIWEDDISQHLQLEQDKYLHVFRHCAVLTAMERLASRFVTHGGPRR